jgi:hypothetical protein
MRDSAGLSPRFQSLEFETRSPLTRFVFSAWGVPISVDTNDPQLIPALLDHLPPTVEPTSTAPKYSYTLQADANFRDGDRAYKLQIDRATVLSSKRLTEVLQEFESTLQLQIADTCQSKIFVHSGVVGWRGKAILIPGRSGTGKSTLVAALVKAGATYYSDEYAVLDGDGHVHPYARRLSMRLEDTKVRMRCTPNDLGGTEGKDPLPVGVVLVTHYCHAAKWHPRPVSAGRAVLALIDNTVSIRRQPEEALATLCRSVSGALAFESCRGEATDVAQLLLAQ